MTDVVNTESTMSASHDKAQRGLREYAKSLIDGADDDKILHAIGSLKATHSAPPPLAPITMASAGDTIPPKQPSVKLGKRQNRADPVATLVRNLTRTSSQVIWTVDEIYEALKGAVAIPRDSVEAKNKIKRLIVSASHTFNRHSKDQFYIKTRHAELMKQ